MSDLSFHPDGQALLNGVSFHVSHAQLIAIVGKSGSGKSTLLRAIAGELRHTGCVEADGSVTFMRQNPPLLPDTLRENVAMHREIDDETIASCLKQAAASDLIQRLGDTLSEGRGSDWTPSGGERQRIGLARALCGQPDILLLDEPTSALAEAEMEVFKMLRALMEERQIIILMVTHRVSLAEKADQIMVMEGGQLVEQGRPGELKHRKKSACSRLLEGVQF